MHDRIAQNAKHLSQYLYPNDELQHELDATKITCEKLAKETRQFTIHIKHKNDYKRKEKMIKAKMLKKHR